MKKIDISDLSDEEQEYIIGLITNYSLKRAFTDVFVGVGERLKEFGDAIVKVGESLKHSETIDWDALREQSEKLSSFD